MISEVRWWIEWMKKVCMIARLESGEEGEELSAISDLLAQLSAHFPSFNPLCIISLFSKTELTHPMWMRIAVLKPSIWDVHSIRTEYLRNE
jgi:hypothetical protein